MGEKCMKRLNNHEEFPLYDTVHAMRARKRGHRLLKNTFNPARPYRVVSRLSPCFKDVLSLMGTRNATGKASNMGYTMKLTAKRFSGCSIFQ